MARPEPLILIADDEESFRVPLRDNLELEGYRVIAVSDGQSAVEAAVARKPDLLLLDIMMPKLSGFDVCRALQRQGTTISTIILSARDQEVDIVLGLELGADDYVTKPFSLRELLARIKAVLRRQERLRNKETLRHGAVRIGEALIDFGKYEAARRGKAMPMTPREFAILGYMLGRKGEVVSRDDLLNEVWGYDQFPTTRTVDNHMVRIRKLIEPNPRRPTVLVSVRGVGYRLLQQDFAEP